MELTREQTTSLPDSRNKKTCSAFCPQCGADLYYLDSECICKNKECSWSCLNCHQDVTP
jgi:hypothetical protein